MLACGRDRARMRGRATGQHGAKGRRDGHESQACACPPYRQIATSKQIEAIGCRVVQIAASFQSRCCARRACGADATRIRRIGPTI